MSLDVLLKVRGVFEDLEARDVLEGCGCLEVLEDHEAGIIFGVLEVLEHREVLKAREVLEVAAAVEHYNDSRLVIQPAISTLPRRHEPGGHCNTGLNVARAQMDPTQFLLPPFVGLIGIRREQGLRVRCTISGRLDCLEGLCDDIWTAQHDSEFGEGTVPSVQPLPVPPPLFLALFCEPFSLCSNALAVSQTKVLHILLQCLEDFDKTTSLEPRILEFPHKTLQTLSPHLHEFSNCSSGHLDASGGQTNPNYQLFVEISSPSLPSIP